MTSFYIVYQAYEVESLNLDYYCLNDWETVRYSLDGKQAILRIRDEYLEFFNLSRALTEDEALSLVAGPAWTASNPTTSNVVS